VSDRAAHETERNKEASVRTTLKRSLGALLLVLLAAATATGQPAEEPAVRALLFSSPTCPHCRIVRDEVLPPLFARFGSRLNVVTVSTATRSGLGLYNEAVGHFAITRRGVPLLLVGDAVLVGSDEIPARFPELIERHLAAGGVSWPELPGLAALLTTAQPTPLPAPPVEAERVKTEQAQPASTAPPRVSGVVAAVPPMASTPTKPSSAPVASPLARFRAAPHANPATNAPAKAVTAREPDALLATAAPLGAHALDADRPGLVARVGADPVGNALAIAVLAAMIVLVLYSLPVLSGARAAVRTARLDWLAPILAAAGVGVAAYLAHVEIHGAQAVCGPVGDCNTVQQSAYARLFGVVPIGVLGVVGFSVILLVWTVRRVARGPVAARAAVLLLALTAGGTLFSIYLTFLEPFVIGATCLWCLSSSVLMTVLYCLALSPGRAALAEVRPSVRLRP
jgi:uncharacterized membrane protein